MNPDIKRVSIKTRFKYFLTGTFITIGLLTMSVLLKSEKPINEEVISEARELAKPTIYDIELELVKGIGTPKKDYNHRHIQSAKKNGVGSLKDTNSISSIVANGNLIEVVPDKGYAIAPMTHSYPYLTKEALLLLRTIGESFYEASGDNSFFTVSSLTRTEETQKKLRKRNSNAAKNESSHCYGVSFDISYIRYNGVREWHYERTKKLEAILAEMQKKGQIYVLKERKQSCFHITVRTDS